MPNTTTAKSRRGSVLIRPVQAKLYRDVELFKKMDPYCLLTMNGISLKGTVCKRGGKTPHWDDIMVFGVREGTRSCILELMDKDRVTSDDLIGICEIDLMEAEANEKQLKWYELHYKTKLAGEVLIETIFMPNEYPEKPLFYVNNKRVESENIYGQPADRNASRHIMGYVERVQNRTDSPLRALAMNTMTVQRHGSSKLAAKSQFHLELEAFKFDEDENGKSRSEGDASLLTKDMLVTPHDFLLESFKQAGGK